MVADLPSLLADLDTDTRNILLTLARIWTTLATGEIRSKDGAARWALVRLPVELRAPLDRARASYLGAVEAVDSWDESLAAVHATAAWMVDEIVGLRGS
jgi:streptomycin 3"-adenylyltransferase